MPSLWIPLAVVVVVVATDVWVFLDASRWAAEGTPVYLRIGALKIDTPVAWLICCLLLWVVFLPAYLVSRKG